MSDPQKPSQPQIDKFLDLARQLEADENEARFEEAVKKVAPKYRSAPQNNGNDHES